MGSAPTPPLGTGAGGGLLPVPGEALPRLQGDSGVNSPRWAKDALKNVDIEQEFQRIQKQKTAQAKPQNVKETRAEYGTQNGTVNQQIFQSNGEGKGGVNEGGCDNRSLSPEAREEIYRIERERIEKRRREGDEGNFLDAERDYSVRSDVSDSSSNFSCPESSSSFSTPPSPFGLRSVCYPDSSPSSHRLINYSETGLAIPSIHGSSSSNSIAPTNSFFFGTTSGQHTTSVLAQARANYRQANALRTQQQQQQQNVKIHRSRPHSAPDEIKDGGVDRPPAEPVKAGQPQTHKSPVHLPITPSPYKTPTAQPSSFFDHGSDFPSRTRLPLIEQSPVKMHVTPPVDPPGRREST
eukprot:gb/GEZN01008490.1/.p1 GENE.gb/GEZN01008490.1/~~gb/GEZN01008490.1/.p1  ORF type:complete len:379 (+),score=47.73 gb/GEZN01008490.1/:82-1137(+)